MRDVLRICVYIFLLAGFPLRAFAPPPPPSTVTMYSDYVAPGWIDENVSDAFIRFYFLNDQATQVYVTGITVTKAGTIPDAGVQVAIYRSTDNVWDASDALVAGPSPFSGGTVTFSGLSEPVTDTIQYYYFVVLTPGTGTTGETAGANFVDPCFTIDTGTAVCNTTNYDPIPVGQPPPDTMIVEPFDIAPFYAAPGEVDVPVLAFDLYALSGDILWQSITVYLGGTGAVDGDISAVKIYRESGITPGFQPLEDVLVSSGTDTFAGGSVTINLTSREMITTSPQRYYVVFDISPAASDLHNVAAVLQSTSFTVETPHTVSSLNLPFSSKEIDIIDPTSLIGTLSYVVVSCNQVVLSWNFSGDENSNSYTRFDYGTNNTWGDADDVVACAEVRGAPLRNCTVTGIDLTVSPLYFRALHYDPDSTSGGVTVDVNTAYVAVGPVDCATVTGNPPVVNILSPADGEVVAGNVTYPVLIQVSVWDAETPHTGLTIEMSVDGGAWDATGWTYNANWEDVNNNLYVYEKQWVPAVPGVHTIAIRAVDADGNAGYAYKNLRVYVNSVTPQTVGGTAIFPGSGFLLRRGGSSTLCMSCHSVANHAGYVWGSTKYGNWSINCTTCHTPHSTSNVYLVRETIQTPNSGTRQVVFKALRGTEGDAVDGSLGDDTDNAFTDVCEVCHTKTSYHRNDFSTPVTTHHNAVNCVGCHAHLRGFAPSTDSYGNLRCCQCHSDLFNSMNTIADYHHFMNNCEVDNAGGKYPTSDQLGGTTDPNRNCLMCHVDHEVFRPELNPEGSRGANLRVSVLITPDVKTDSGFTNTDFGYTTGTATFTNGSTVVTGAGTNWQSNMTGWYIKADGDGIWYTVAGVAPPDTIYLTSAFAGTSFTGGYTLISPDGKYAGVCLSCHRKPQTKSYPQPDGTTQTPAIVADNFRVSAHQYKVQSTFGTDGSIFNANCSKCHNDTLNPKSDKNAQTSTYTFGNHLSTLRSILATMGIATPLDPLEENFCYRCHSQSTDTNPGGGPAKPSAGLDYYQVASMSAESELIFSIFNTRTYTHPVNANSGIHKIGDGSAYNDGSLTGANRHSECMDCHNPHEATPDDPLKGAGGVSVNNPLSNFAELTATNYSYVVTPTVTVLQPNGVNKINLDYRLCLKCHSNWAYGASTNAPNPTPSATWQQTNQAVEFNVNNWSYHYVEGDLVASVAPDPGTPGTCNSFGPSGYPNITPRASQTTGNFNQTYIAQMEPSLAGLTDAEIRQAKLRCSSCHGVDGAGTGMPEGPHGSAYAFMLKVPAGSPYTRWDNNVAWWWNRGSIWCFNCHDPDFTNTGFATTGGTNLHTVGFHARRPCQGCHSAIPHGWKRYRFLVCGDCDPAPYLGVSSTYGLQCSGIIWQTSGNWYENACHNGGVGTCG